MSSLALINRHYRRRHSRNRFAGREVPPSVDAGYLVAPATEGPAERSAAEPLPITSTKIPHCCGVPCTPPRPNSDFSKPPPRTRCYGSWRGSSSDTSKADSMRVIEETGVAAVSYPRLICRLPVSAKSTFRQSLSAAFPTEWRSPSPGRLGGAAPPTLSTHPPPSSSTPTTSCGASGPSDLPPQPRLVEAT